MKYRIINTGFGGQGIMLLGKLMAYTGMKNNKEVLWMPSYGSEMRGGTANCSVIISDSAIETPVFKKSDCTIVMNKPSFIKFESRVKKGGDLIYNSSLINLKPKREDINFYKIPANEIAESLGTTKISNMIMLGAFCEVTKLFEIDEISKNINEVLSKKYNDMIEVNKKALLKGKEYITKMIK